MSEYSLHSCVFNNDFQKLKSILTQSKVSVKNENEMKSVIYF